MKNFFELDLVFYGRANFADTLNLNGHVKPSIRNIIDGNVIAFGVKVDTRCGQAHLDPDKVEPIGRT